MIISNLEAVIRIYKHYFKNLSKTQMSFENPYVKRIEYFTELIRTPTDLHLTDIENMFQQKYPLVLDIGCGAGNFLVSICQANPNFNFVGIELRYKRLFKAAQKITKYKLSNVCLIRIRAENLANYFKPGSISKIFINFPDPWPKKKHKKNRLLTSNYVKILHSLLKYEGFLFFKTDSRDYFEEICPIFLKHFSRQFSSFKDMSTSFLLGKEPKSQDFVSEFEDIFKIQGLKIYQLLLQK